MKHIKFKQWNRTFFSFILSITIFILIPFSVKAACPISYSSNASLTSSVTERYNLAPAEIRTLFEKKGWTIRIDNADNIFSLIGTSSLPHPKGFTFAGVTITEPKIICLSDQGNYSLQSINHELGHFVDYSYQDLFNSTRPSQTDTFKQIYNSEKAAAANDYVRSTSDEYFAEAFKSYVETPAKLQSTAPATFQYVSATVTAINKSVDTLYPQVAQAASASAQTAALPQKTYPAGTFVYNGVDFTSVFSPEYYYNNNADLQQAIGYNPQALFNHYIKYGVAEGRAAIG